MPPKLPPTTQRANLSTLNLTNLDADQEENGIERIQRVVGEHQVIKPLILEDSSAFESTFSKETELDNKILSGLNTSIVDNSSMHTSITTILAKEQFLDELQKNENKIKKRILNSVDLNFTGAVARNTINTVTNNFLSTVIKFEFMIPIYGVLERSKNNHLTHSTSTTTNITDPVSINRIYHEDHVFTYHMTILELFELIPSLMSSSASIFQHLLPFDPLDPINLITSTGMNDDDISITTTSAVATTTTTTTTTTAMNVNTQIQQQVNNQFSDPHSTSFLSSSWRHLNSIKKFSLTLSTTDRGNNPTTKDNTTSSQITHSLPPLTHFIPPSAIISTLCIVLHSLHSNTPISSLLPFPQREKKTRGESSNQMMVIKELIPLLDPKSNPNIKPSNTPYNILSSQRDHLSELDGVPIVDDRNNNTASSNKINNKINNKQPIPIIIPKISKISLHQSTQSSLQPSIPPMLMSACKTLVSLLYSVLLIGFQTQCVKFSISQSYNSLDEHESTSTSSKSNTSASIRESSVLMKDKSDQDDDNKTSITPKLQSEMTNKFKKSRKSISSPSSSSASSSGDDSGTNSNDDIDDDRDSITTTRNKKLSKAEQKIFDKKNEKVNNILAKAHSNTDYIERLNKNRQVNDKARTNQLKSSYQDDDDDDESDNNTTTTTTVSGLLQLGETAPRSLSDTYNAITNSLFKKVGNDIESCLKLDKKLCERHFSILSPSEQLVSRTLLSFRYTNPLSTGDGLQQDYLDRIRYHDQWEETRQIVETTIFNNSKPSRIFIPIIHNVYQFRNSTKEERVIDLKSRKPRPGDVLLSGDSNTTTGSNGSIYCPTMVWDLLLPHQQKGLQWLTMKSTQQTGCILADEMGLGKSVQIGAFLATQYYSWYLGTTPSSFRSIVVVPASLITLWLHELHVWCPSLRVYTWFPTESPHQVSAAGLSGGSNNSHSEAYYGPGINSLEQYRQHVIDSINRNSNRECSVLVVSYHSLSSPLLQEFVQETKFNHLIMDECQHIANPKTKAHKNALKIDANWRVLLTGTPIQNSLEDLWSLLLVAHIPLPGPYSLIQDVLKKQRTEEEVRTAIKVCHLIRKSITPYLLRRLKENTVRLPPQKHSIVMITMKPQQALKYNSYIKLMTSFSHTNVNNNPFKNKHGKIRNQLFSGIGYLLRIATHPDLVENSLMTEEKKQRLAAKEKEKEKAKFAATKTNLTAEQKAMQEDVTQRLKKQRQENILANHHADGISIITSAVLPKSTSSTRKSLPSKVITATLTTASQPPPLATSLSSLSSSSPLKTGTTTPATSILLSNPTKTKRSQPVVVSDDSTSSSDSSDTSDTSDTTDSSDSSETDDSGGMSKRKKPTQKTTTKKQATKKSTTKKPKRGSKYHNSSSSSSSSSSDSSGSDTGSNSDGFSDADFDLDGDNDDDVDLFDDSLEGHKRLAAKRNQANKKNGAIFGTLNEDILLGEARCIDIIRRSRCGLIGGYFDDKGDLNQYIAGPNQPEFKSEKTTKDHNQNSKSSSVMAAITQKYPCIREIPEDWYGSYHNSEKIQCILQLLCTWLCQGHKVTIFSSSVKALNMLCQHIRPTWLRIDGSTPILQRSHIASLFNTGVCPLLFASTKCVSEGITLSNTDKVILVSSSFNPAADAQCLARTHRLGRTKECHVYTMMVKNSIESYVLHTQHRKSVMADAVLKGTADTKKITGRGLYHYLREYQIAGAPPTPIHGVNSNPAMRLRIVSKDGEDNGERESDGDNDNVHKKARREIKLTTATSTLAPSIMVDAIGSYISPQLSAKTPTITKSHSIITDSISLSSNSSSNSDDSDSSDDTDDDDSNPNRKVFLGKKPIYETSMQIIDGSNTVLSKLTQQSTDDNRNKNNNNNNGPGSGNVLQDDESKYVSIFFANQEKVQQETKNHKLDAIIEAREAKVMKSGVQGDVDDDDELSGPIDDIEFLTNLANQHSKNEHDINNNSSSNSTTTGSSSMDIFSSIMGSIAQDYNLNVANATPSNIISDFHQEFQSNSYNKFESQASRTSKDQFNSITQKMALYQHQQFQRYNKLTGGNNTDSKRGQHVTNNNNNNNNNTSSSSSMQDPAGNAFYRPPMSSSTGAPPQEPTAMSAAQRRALKRGGASAPGPQPIHSSVPTMMRPQPFMAKGGRLPPSNGVMARPQPTTTRVRSPLMQSGVPVQTTTTTTSRTTASTPTKTSVSSHPAKLITPSSSSSSSSSTTTTLKKTQSVKKELAQESTTPSSKPILAFFQPQSTTQAVNDDAVITDGSNVPTPQTKCKQSGMADQ